MCLVRKYCRPSAALSSERASMRATALELERSTLADCVGASTALIQPLDRGACAGQVMSVGGPTRRRHAGAGVGSRRWAGRRRAGCGLMSATSARTACKLRRRRLYFYSPDRKGEHPQAPLEDLQAASCRPTAMPASMPLYRPGRRWSRSPAWRTSGASSSTCMRPTASPIAKEALDRIGALYGIEAEVCGRPPDERQQATPANELAC